MASDSAQPALPYEVFDLTRLVDDAGTLHFGHLAELRISSVDRICLITNVPEGRSRGEHAHKTQDEYIICAQGCVTVRLESRGRVAVVPLGHVGRALHLPAGHWRSLTEFTSDAVLLLLSTGQFDEADYIRDYSAFLEWELRS
jgi:dTDP-4-dehydrorhamnose 3,5-epimerase-like enzyme